MKQDWLDLDVDQIEAKPITAEQKLKIKKHVLSNSKARKRFNGRYLAAAALLGISVVTVSFLTVPAIANQIPFIESILTYFNDDPLPDSYADLATVINQVQSDNGIDVMIENAVYDGTNIIMTYAIQTEADLGEHLSSKNILQVREASGLGGSSSIEKINDTTYVGIDKVTPHFDSEGPEEVLIEWEPGAFEDMKSNKRIEGDWKFEFTLGQLPTNIQLLNEAISEKGITLVMKSLEKSAMAAVIQFDYYVAKPILQKSPFVTIEMVEVKDNLGNVYTINDNGGVSHDNGASNAWSATIYSLDPNATSLTLTPQVHYSKGSGEMLETSQMEPVTIRLD